MAAFLSHYEADSKQISGKMTGMLREAAQQAEEGTRAKRRCDIYAGVSLRLRVRVLHM